MIVLLAAAGGWLLAGAIVVSAHWAAASRATGVARACHELRGPLFAIGLGVELASRGVVLPSERVRGLELELGRAARALDELAQVGGVRAEPRPAERVDLSQLLRESAPAWRDEARDRAVRVELPAASVFVAGERLRVVQALANLVVNAIEHGEGELVVVLCERAGVARVEVCDEGPGLPVPLAALLGRRAWLPGPRWAGVRPGRRVAAHGHGLRIVAGVAAAHGGRLISAPAQRGARMVLELPLAGEHVRCPGSTK